MEPHKGRIAPGETVDVSVYVNDVEDLMAYQLSLNATEGNAGEMTWVSAWVDRSRSDVVFAGETLDAVNAALGLVGVVNMYGSTSVDEPAYLATFRFEASSDAAGTFVIDLADAVESIFVAGDRREMPVQKSEPVTIKVSANTTPSIRGADTHK
jgi:hypothetical protein